MTDDGMIADPAEADLQRAERSLPRRGGPQPNGHAAPTDLTMVAANRRRVEASCADLEDELHVLRSTCAAPQDVQRWLREELGPIAARLRAIPPRLAGLDDQVHAALTELAEVEDADPPVVARPRARPATAAALAAYRVSMLSERAEITTALRRGELVRTSDAVAEVADRMAAARSALMNLSATVLSDGDVLPEVERIVGMLTEPVDHDPPQFDGAPRPARVNGHDRPPGHSLAAPEQRMRKTMKDTTKHAPPRRPGGKMTGPEKMELYNERVAVAVGLGLPFKRLGRNGTTFASHAAADAALAKVNAAIEAATA